MKSIALSTLILVALTACGAEGETDEASAAPAWRESRTQWTAEGGLRRIGSDGRDSEWLHEAEIESNDVLDSSHTTTQVEGAGFRFERIEIRIEAAHPLLGIAAEAMIDGLSGIPGVRVIDCPGAAAPEVEPVIAPDLAIRIHAPEIPEPEVVDGKIHHDLLVLCDATVPIFRQVHTLRPSYHATLRLQHRSTTTVKRSRGLSAPRSRDAGQAIGRQFAASIKKDLEALIKEQGLGAAIPEALIAPPTATPPLPFPEGADIRLMSSRRAIRVSNETIWVVRTADGAESFVAAFGGRLAEDGWDVREDDTLALSMVRGPERLFVVNESPRRDDAKTILRVTYSRLEPDDEWEARLQALDWKELDAAVLLALTPVARAELKRAVYRHLESRPLTSWRQYSRLLDHFEYEGRGEDLIRKTLTKAAVRARKEGAFKELAKRWSEPLKTWGLDVRPLDGLTAEEMVASGVPEISVGKDETFEVDFDEPLRFVTREGDELVGFEVVIGLDRWGARDQSGFLQIARRRSAGNHLTVRGIRIDYVPGESLFAGRTQPIVTANLDDDGSVTGTITATLMPGMPPRLRVSVARSK